MVLGSPSGHPVLGSTAAWLLALLIRHDQAIVAVFAAVEHIDLIGFGVAESKGLKRGAIVNLEATVESIKKSVAEAEAMAKCEIDFVLEIAF